VDIPAELADLVRRPRKGGHAGNVLVRVATVPRDEGDQWLISARFEFNEEAGAVRSSRTFRYPGLTLAARHAKPKTAIQWLDELLHGRPIFLPGLDAAVTGPQMNGLAHRLRSGENIGLVGSGWPIVYLDCSGGQPQEIQLILDSSNRLSAPRTPLYPSLRSAVCSFVHGRHGAHDSAQGFPTLLALARDTRARIMGLHFKAGLLRVQVQTDGRSSCSVQSFASVDRAGDPSCTAQVEKGQAVLELGAEHLPQYLLVGLIGPDSAVLDERELGFAWGRGPADLVVAPETRELVVRQWIEGGESNKIEFKMGLKPKDGEKASDLLESVVAFANSGGGTVVLGVSDHGEVVGFRRAGFGDVVQEMLHQRCDPIPSVEVELVELDGKPLTLLHVASGRTGTLYALDRVKFYVRAGATDRLARAEEAATRFQVADGVARF
jgi:hypothetical protein